MHGAHETTDLIAGILHGTNDTYHAGLLRFLYEKLEMSPKRLIPTCIMFSTFVDTFREKLSKLLDDVEQFFLWVVAAMLDGMKTGF